MIYDAKTVELVMQLTDIEKNAMKTVEEKLIKTGIQQKYIDRIEAYKLIISN